MKTRLFTARLSTLAPLAAAAIAATLVSGEGGSETGPGPEDIFVTSETCQACHNNLAVEDGEDLSIGAAWRATMMAHSSKDPYWRAGVRRETIDHPTARAAIEDECSTCHLPMARFMRHMAGQEGLILSDSTDDPIGLGGPLGEHAMDGVSCAMCHQIKAEGLGEEESFVGGFRVDTSARPGEREILGPYDIARATTRVMSSASGFAPERADHVQSSELCATCHTLYTHALDENGEAAGVLPEQVPYLEWLHGDNAAGKSDEKSCQTCHMKEAREPSPISSVVGKPRERMSRHSFRGGNFFVLKLIAANRLDVSSTAEGKDLDVSVRSTEEHLESKAARVSILHEGTSIGDSGLTVRVAVDNLAGHKLPTAYPSRRTWIHLAVKDSSGNLVFESGALEDDGSIAGNDNDDDPAAFEPHHQEITSAEQVQIYEAIMKTPAGKVTTGLLQATGYLKDNRITPRGFDKETADPDIAVHGAARADPSFAGGRDEVVYSVEVDAEKGPFEVVASAWYQPVGYRWAKNLEEYDADEPAAFTRMYGEMEAEDTAVLLARDAVVVERPVVVECPEPEPEEEEIGE